MPTVKFKSEQIVHKVAGDIRFRAGEIVEMSDASAARWLKRGVVELLSDAPPATSGRSSSDKSVELVDIPIDWQTLPWPQLKALAVKVSDAPVVTKPDAIAAIEAEIKRRGGSGSGDHGKGNDRDQAADSSETDRGARDGSDEG